MYPTVCCLLGLWRYVTATGFTTYDATDEARTLLATINPDDLKRPETWRRLAILVELEPERDLLPVRAKYDGASYTIGLNYLSTDGVSLWHTLADAVVDVLNGEHPPKVRRAIGFRPGPLQDGLLPVDLMGNPAYRVDPATDDVFQRLVELRSELKARRDAARASGQIDLADVLDADQLALKILANAITYGIYIELNVTDSDDLVDLTCHGRSDEPFSWRSRQMEAPGTVLPSAPRHAYHWWCPADAWTRGASRPRGRPRLGFVRYRFDDDRAARWDGRA
jgi:hypothetical protein